MGSRRQGREDCLQCLYAMETGRISAKESWRAVVGSGKKKTLPFGKNLLEGTARERDKIDALIKKHCHNWKLDRMASIDRNIIRMATYEILAMPETPVKVIINEAVEIAKKYSTDESGKFVNGILDKMKDERPVRSESKN